MPARPTGWLPGPGAACAAWLVLGLSLAACTEPGRSQVVVSIDADYAVRRLIDGVEVTVEVQETEGGGWQEIDTRRFWPNTRDKWPLDFTLDASASRGMLHQLTATARDKNRSVLAQALAVRRFSGGYVLPLRVLFETSCFRRTEPCSGGLTCHDGQCVDPAYDGAELEPSDASLPDGGAPSNEGQGVAVEGDACSTEGAQACAPAPLRAPVSCVGGIWQTQASCVEGEECDGSTGTCRPVKDECMGRPPNVEFCDGDIMLVCKSKFASEIRACGENEHCVTPETQATCDCRFGFVKEGAICREATSCAINRGGCDPLTECSVVSGKRVCSACPDGYVGDGVTGCEPVLTAILSSHGQLEPAFSPTVMEYRLKVPLIVQRLSLTPSAAGSVRIQFNGDELPAFGSWTTPILPLGESTVELTLSTGSGSHRSYTITIEREGRQTTYIKAHNADFGDAFGTALAMDGDTLVASAMYEDGNADSPNDDNEGASDAGAVYVFVRRGTTWEQQQYLKAGDAVAQDYFGASISISGDRLVVGAIRADLLNPIATPTRGGVVYVFTREQGRWRETARLTPKASAAGDLFGYGVSLQGDTLLVSAAREGGSGAAYIFEWSGDTWVERHKFKPTTPVMGGLFGSAVAMSGDTIVVASQEDRTELNGAGSATIFVRRDDKVVEQQRIVPTPPSAGASFGFAAAARGDVIMVGAPRIRSILGDTTAPGEVFVYERTAGVWTQTQLLRAAVPRESDGFGSGVALSDTAALIGACGDHSESRGIGGDAAGRNARWAGAAYLYARGEKDWEQSAYVKAANADRDDMFGIAVALSGETAVVGAIWEGSRATGINGNADDNSLTTAGAVYVFE